MTLSKTASEKIKTWVGVFALQKWGGTSNETDLQHAEPRYSADMTDMAALRRGMHDHPETDTFLMVGVKASREMNQIATLVQDT